jgi:tight adherence protein B
MNISALALKYAGFAFCGIGVLGMTLILLVDRHSFLNRMWLVYVAHLERKLRNMFITTPGSHIAIGQCVALVMATSLGLYLHLPFWWVAIPLIMFAPTWFIERMRKERVRLIDARIDSFAMTLANSLRATPNVGSALGYSQPLMLAPMSDELALVIKETRVGSTIDQALLNMSGRIKSIQLDATLASLLIGRQVGGDLPKILETTASTLREMSRLQGVVRAKTAEGRLQVSVLAIAPAFLLVGFDAVRPGYFAPLTDSIVGWIIVILATVLWLAALIISRQVLKVNL